MSQQNEQLVKIRHSAEHILTMAMRKFYPDMKMAMGPAIDEGFYFDVDLGDQKVTEADFGKIEKEMWRIVNKKLPFEQQAVEIAEAQKLFEGNPYKQEWLDEIEQKGEKATLYWTGKGSEDEFVDLCAGPHVDNSEEVKAFKLLSVAGAYWHGDEKNKMLTRIYGTAFGSKEELQEHLHMLEEAKKRDHRILNSQLDLFSQSEDMGPGLILWHPNLSTAREEIELWWRQEHRKKGYQYVYTPHIGKKILWDTSGHTGFYKDLMYPPMTDERNDVYYVKPMNCNGHILIYKSKPHSYKEMPIRYCELGTVYRYELEGVRHGILRTRGFTQDDSHIFCTKEQLLDEVEGVLDFALEMNKVFGFDDLHYELSVHDPANKDKYAGKPEEWETAENTLRDLLKKRGVDFTEDPGGAKFYGPSIDLKAEDAIGRLWQGTTIQFDFNLPTRFDLTYIDQDGKEQRPYMVHRTLLGAFERFMGVLIEQYAGAFPVWLAPTQVVIVPISEKFDDYAQSLKKALAEKNIRVAVDNSNDSMQKRIREAEKQKVPYMLVVGEKEEQSSQVAVRARGRKDLGTMKLADFEKLIREDIEQKKIW
ncbi:threonine--tRNA ligase [Candidatus Beckwithbacteria bacterium]|nr:threonine--tRNA ligase [Candidatus Beckwithbacteria bacterium]